MDRDEIQQRLREGIAAVKRGELERGRELLLQVIEADDQVEPAWLWLSVAMPDPADKLVALDNALTLNPRNPQAQAQAQQLRRQLGLEPPPPPEPPRPAPPPAPERAIAAPLNTAVDPDDDPNQCAFCGRPTQESDDHCPHCGRSLLVPAPWEGAPYRYGLLILNGLILQAAILQFVGPLWALGRARGFDFSLLLTFSRLPFVTSLFGDFANWSESDANVRLAVAVARIFVWGIVLLMFYTDMEAAHAVAMFAALGDAAWAVLGHRLEFLGPGAALMNGVLAGFTLLLSGIIVLGRWQSKKRQFVVLDRGARATPDLYKRGHAYARQGKWALAVIHLRKAVAVSPNAAQLYKDLAAAQARLGRYEKALDALRDGAERAPGDAEFRRLIQDLEARPRRPS